MKYVPYTFDSGPNDPPPRQVHRAALTLLVLTGVVVVLGYLGLGMLADWAARQVPIDVEIDVFAEGSGRWEGPTLLDAQDPHRIRVERVFQSLDRSSMNPAWRVSLGVLDEAQPNAFALPGGRILVTSGLLELLPDDGNGDRGLAFVLGHELGHLHHRDHLRGLGRSLVLGLGVSILFGTDGLGWILSAGTELDNLAYSRAQEVAADGFACEIMMRSFGSLMGAEAFFQALVQESPGALPDFLSTHPDVNDRLDRLLRLQEES